MKRQIASAPILAHLDHPGAPTIVSKDVLGITLGAVLMQRNTSCICFQDNLTNRTEVFNLRTWSACMHICMRTLTRVPLWEKIHTGNWYKALPYLLATASPGHKPHDFDIQCTARAKHKVAEMLSMLVNEARYGSIVGDCVMGIELDNLPTMLFWAKSVTSFGTVGTDCVHQLNWKCTSDWRMNFKCSITNVYHVENVLSSQFMESAEYDPWRSPCNHRRLWIIHGMWYGNIPADSVNPVAG